MAFPLLDHCAVAPPVATFAEGQLSAACASSNSATINPQVAPNRTVRSFGLSSRPRPAVVACKDSFCIFDYQNPIIKLHTEATILMPNEAKRGPVQPVSTDLKVPQRRRLQRRLLRTAARFDDIWPRPLFDGKEGVANLCLSTWVRDI